MHVYIAEVAKMMGLQEALGRVGSHPAGVDPNQWREQIADDAARAVADGWINLALAHDMVFVADLMVAEMVRHPQIIDWDNILYAGATYNGFDPATAAYEVKGLMPPSSADQFINDFLDGLIEEPANA
jgi:hypothetical protein